MILYDKHRQMCVCVCVCVCVFPSSRSINLVVVVVVVKNETVVRSRIMQIFNLPFFLCSTRRENFCYCVYLQVVVLHCCCGNI